MHRATPLPWVEKYRPSQLTDLVSNNDIVQKLIKLYNHQAIPHLIFYGPPGTGKTSTILAYARMINHVHSEGLLLELNASDERDVDTIKNIVCQFARKTTLLKQADNAYKIVILDEADAMTTPAQDALAHLIDKFGEHVRFCLICNKLSRIGQTLQSRCIKFRFAPLAPLQIKKALQRIIDHESIAIAFEAVDALVVVCQGDLRRCFNMLQTVYTLAQQTGQNQPICAADIYSMLGQPSPAQVKTLVHTIITLASPKQAHHDLKQFLHTQAVSLTMVLQIWHQLLSSLRFTCNPSHLRHLARIEERLHNNTNTYLNTACFVMALRTGDIMPM